VTANREGSLLPQIRKSENCPKNVKSGKFLYSCKEKRNTDLRKTNIDYNLTLLLLAFDWNNNAHISEKCKIWKHKIEVSLP
jgi:hypothetical protein